VFFFDFSKKGIFIGYLELFFDKEEQSKKYVLHYKPCKQTWVMEKINGFFANDYHYH
jgi:hypothetical protein